MTAKTLLDSSQSGAALQREVNAFVDEFRRADGAQRSAMIADGPTRCGKREGLVAAVVSALAREVALQPPAWVACTYSTEPYFAFPGESFAMRVRLMLESPAPFRIRNVFVPENYLHRA